MAQRPRRAARQQQAARRQQTGRQQPAAAAPQPIVIRIVRPGQALSVPLVFSLALVGCSALPAVREHQRLLWSFWGAGATLLAWNAALYASAARRGRAFGLSIELRKQHYLQACAQSAVLIYWGWYWREVY